MNSGIRTQVCHIVTFQNCREFDSATGLPCRIGRGSNLRCTCGVCDYLQRSNSRKIVVIVVIIVRSHFIICSQVTAGSVMYCKIRYLVYAPQRNELEGDTASIDPDAC